MSKESFEQASADLGMARDLTIQALMSLLHVTDTAHRRIGDEQMERIVRMHLALDRVPRREP